MPDARVQSAIAHWAPRFVSNGVPLADFQEVTAGVERWEDWCRAWSARAAVHEALGREALAAGHGRSAGAHLTRAAVCYHFSKFVFVVDYEQMREAHRKAVECRNLALPHIDPPGERVLIPYEGKTLAGILRRPQGAARPPVVVMCMGLDSAKEEMDTNESVFLARGMATLTFDGPGQGEGEYDFAIRGDYELDDHEADSFVGLLSDAVQEFPQYRLLDADGRKALLLNLVMEMQREAAAAPPPDCAVARVGGKRVSLEPSSWRG